MKDFKFLLEDVGSTDYEKERKSRNIFIINQEKQKVFLFFLINETKNRKIFNYVRLHWSLTRPQKDLRQV